MVEVLIYIYKEKQFGGCCSSCHDICVNPPSPQPKYCMALYGEITKGFNTTADTLQRASIVVSMNHTHPRKPADTKCEK